LQGSVGAFIVQKRIKMLVIRQRLQKPFFLGQAYTTALEPSLKPLGGFFPMDTATLVN